MMNRPMTSASPRDHGDGGFQKAFQRLRDHVVELIQRPILQQGLDVGSQLFVALQEAKNSSLNFSPATAPFSRS